MQRNAAFLFLANFSTSDNFFKNSSIFHLKVCSIWHATTSSYPNYCFNVRMSLGRGLGLYTPSGKLYKIVEFLCKLSSTSSSTLQSLVPFQYFSLGSTGMSGFCTGPITIDIWGTIRIMGVPYRYWLRRSTQYRYKGFWDSVVVLQLQSFCGNTKVTAIDSTFYSTQQDSTYVY